MSILFLKLFITPIFKESIEDVFRFKFFYNINFIIHPYTIQKVIYCLSSARQSNFASGN